MKQRNRKRFDPAFKARVALAAVQERESLTQLGKKFGVHPVLVGQWKKQLRARRDPLPARPPFPSDHFGVLAEIQVKPSPIA